MVGIILKYWNKNKKKKLWANLKLKANFYIIKTIQFVFIENFLIIYHTSYQNIFYFVIIFDKNTIK